MSRDTDRRVALLDLRGRSVDPRDVVDDDRIEGLLVVVDDAAALEGRKDLYEKLLGGRRVTSLICVAVGRADDGPALTRPPAFAIGRRSGVLWVGDPDGVRWRPADGMARSVRGPRERSALDELLAALREPMVFRSVLRELERLPFATASPGLWLIFVEVAMAELAAVQGRAVRTVLAEDAVSGTADDFHTLLTKIGEEPGATSAALVPGSTLDAARADAVARLDAAEHSVGALAGPAALLGRDRPARNAYALLQRTGEAALALHDQAGRLLVDLDGHLRTGTPPMEAVTAYGIPEPAPVNRRDIAEELRSAIPARLLQHRSVDRLLREVSRQAAAIGPQGCTAELRRHAATAPVVDEPPAFPAWPLRLSVAVPLAFASCLLAAAGPARPWLGAVLGALVATIWFGWGWLLLARRPDRHGEAGGAATLGRAVAGYGAPALLGLGAGLAGARYAADATWLTPTLGRTFLAAAAVTTVTTLATAWPTAVRTWRGGLQLAAWRGSVEGTTGVVLDATALRWRPSVRHRVVADALVEVSHGLRAVVDQLGANRDGLFGPAPAGPPVAARPELLNTVVADLLDLTVDGLTPCWTAIQVGAGSAQVVHTNRAEQLLEDYRRHVAEYGVLAAPPFARTLGPRAALVTQTWRRATEAAAALQAGADDEMTQLCRDADLGEISGTADDTAVVRVAPVPLRAVLDVEAERWASAKDVHWTEGGAVAGTLRLVEVRRGVVDG